MSYDSTIMTIISTALGLVVRRVMLAFAATTAIAFTLGQCPAYAGTGVLMDDVCRTQYPGSPSAADGTSYLVAPGDAMSWRCKQVSTVPGGGVVANLTPNVEAYCLAQGLGPAHPGPGNSWTCG
jgi:hypothetical protein